MLITMSTDKTCLRSQTINLFLGGSQENHCAFVINGDKLLHMTIDGVEFRWLLEEDYPRIIDTLLIPQNLLVINNAVVYAKTGARMSTWEMIKFLFGRRAVTCTSFVMTCVGMRIDKPIHPKDVIDKVRDWCYNSYID